LFIGKEPHEENCRDVIVVGLTEHNPYKGVLVIFATNTAAMLYRTDQGNWNSYPLVAGG
jgi:hypothetical protein